ncbi:MAG: hypothetical protein ACREQ1_01885 [Woeseiaceae bacterium]
MSQRHLLFPVLSTAIAFFAASKAEAGGDLPFAAEVDSCVAAVNTHLDLADASRVRHLVSNTKRTGIGYVLTIETSVFSDSSERKYEAYCVARGASVPLKFRIEEIAT